MFTPQFVHKEKVNWPPIVAGESRVVGRVKVGERVRLDEEGVKPVGGDVLRVPKGAK